MVDISAGPSSNSQIPGETDTEITYTLLGTSSNDVIFLSVDTISINTVDPQTDITLPGGDVKHWNDDLSHLPGQELGRGIALNGKKVRVFTNLGKAGNPQAASIVYNLNSGHNPIVQVKVTVAGKNPTLSAEYFFTTIKFIQQ